MTKEAASAIEELLRGERQAVTLKLVLENREIYLQWEQINRIEKTGDIRICLPNRLAFWPRKFVEGDLVNLVKSLEDA